MATHISADVLIPGKGDPISNGTVVTDGDNIVYAGPSATAPPVALGDVEMKVPAVMPGMWESHGHFIGSPIPDLEKMASDDPGTLVARATADAAATLDGGITSVREAGGLGISLKPVIDEGTIPGPRIYPAGSILSTTGGHADIHGLPLDFVHSLDSRGFKFGELADGVPGCLLAVRKQLRRGAAVIKICASGGVLSEIDHPIHQQFSHEELVAMVEEAARAERVVAAHCHGEPGIVAALKAGVKTIEHGSYLSEESAQMMIDADAILVPTRFVVAALLGMEDILPPYAYRKGVMIADRHAMAMKIAVAAGVKIAMGTDIFVSGPMYGTNSLEVKYLIDAGMTPLEAIEAATATGPLTLGPLAPKSGQLREGYDPDVIAFDVNPLEDISVWGDPTRVTHIWKAGELVKSPM
ncbi:MAG: amidohydrolase family protein [Acidimicrobiia bacterium]|nr:amidohydrolase family protein [Acidimicrobiia bacterium]MDX2467718.1 amidohydrolase family protein [Acidimicrobiia bacterium]